MARTLVAGGIVPQRSSQTLRVPDYLEVIKSVPQEVIEQIQYRTTIVMIAPRQVQVIKILSDQPGAMAVDIAQQCGRDVSNTVRTLQACEARGWITSELVGRYRHYRLSASLAGKLKGKKGGR
jgi:DNA-binding MarR family transcriptional regulator